MGLLDLFQTRAAEPEPEYETEEKVEPELSDSLLTALLHEDAVGPDRAMDIPAFAAAVDTIAGTVAALPVRLYRRAGDRVEEVRGDRRTELLNCDTGDSLTGAELRKAMVRDYYTRKGGFAYVNRSGNEVTSLHYVDPSHVSVLRNADPIFKEVVYSVDGRSYQPWQFVRILHDTSDGASGSSIVSQNQRLLSVAYQTLRYEQALVSRGGNKRGFLKSPRKLGDKALAALRRGFARLYGSNDENFVVLNDGVEFQEASQTSVEMQLSENKAANARDIYSIFKLPPGIIQGGASEDDRDNFVRYCIMPILAEFKAALDRALLLEEEKPDMYFDFDLTEFSKANMPDRWAAWANAKSQGLVQVDEFRASENLPPLGMDYVNIGLNDVLFDVAKRQMIIPNMGQVIDLNTMQVLSAQNPSVETGEEGPPGPPEPSAPGGGESDES